MNERTVSSASVPSAAADARRTARDLFFISVLLLFLELTCIRWFSAHVLFLTFFTNIVLLSCFLGMSLGCLVARQRRSYLAWTPWLLLAAVVAAFGVELLRGSMRPVLDANREASPQLIYFGTELPAEDVARFVVPLEVLAGFFFVVLALALVGPGQELGRAFNRMPNRIAAYTLNILGSLVGIILFAGMSWGQLAPSWWFLAVAVGLAYFLYPRPAPRAARLRWAIRAAVLLLTAGLAGLRSGPHLESDPSPFRYVRELAQHLFVPGGPNLDPRQSRVEYHWSPYYRIDYHNSSSLIEVNLLGHQHMVSRTAPFLAYSLPHLLNRDVGRPPFRDVLIIGAGSGNDVSRALQWGAEHIDAVEIDPVIYRLGATHHPDRPYDDPRVTVHLGDGRNFLRSCRRQYDLVLYALVDSLVLHSSYSNIRLESYLFTREAFQDARRCLKPDGLFAIYNQFRYGWLVARLHEGLEDVFGADNPLGVTIASLREVSPEGQFPGSALLLAGDTSRLHQAFQERTAYWLRLGVVPGPHLPNGFDTPSRQARARLEDLAPEQRAATGWTQFESVKVLPSAEPIGVATDDWPFLYVRKPMVPNQSLRGALVMAVLALVLLSYFAWPTRQGSGRWAPDGRMFFLGAAFMLIETKAVVHMALLFGSTWMVNSIVFAAVLVMILAANLFVLAVGPRRLAPYYAGLLATLLLNSVIPLDAFLGLGTALQTVGSCLLVFAPIWFAGVIFAVAFAQSAEPDRALGANIAGAMVGGLTEYTSMLLGFRHLVLVAMAFYLLSAVRFRRAAPLEGPPPTVEQTPSSLQAAAP